MLTPLLLPGNCICQPWMQSCMAVSLRKGSRTCPLLPASVVSVPEFLSASEIPWWNSDVARNWGQAFKSYNRVRLSYHWISFISGQTSETFMRLCLRPGNFTALTRSGVCLTWEPSLRKSSVSIGFGIPSVGYNTTLSSRDMTMSRPLVDLLQAPCKVTTGWRRLSALLRSSGMIFKWFISKYL